MFPIFAIKILSSCISLCIIFGGYLHPKFLDVGLLGQRINSYVVLLDIGKFLSVMVVPSLPAMYESDVSPQPHQKSVLSSF